MIKINLLGDDTAIDHSGKFLLLGMAASFALLLALFVLMQVSVNSQVAELSSQTSDLEERLAQLKKITKEVRDLEERKAELDQLTATIAKLKLSQEGPVRVLDDLNRAVPTKAWIREVDENAGGMRIIGLAINDHEIVSFMKNLEASNFFERVDLVESKSVALVKITTLNHFTQKYTRYTVRAEEKDAQLKRIGKEAKEIGLKYQVTDGPPVKSQSLSGTVKVMDTGSLTKARKIESGVFKRSSGRDEKISAWSSVEPVPAKAFTIMAKVSYSGNVKKLLEEELAVKQVGKVQAG